MEKDRITEIRIQGMRTLADVRLKLDGLTVLIGDNGSGKSSIIEACELLRRAANQDFLGEFHRVHGGMHVTAPQGAESIGLGVRATGPKDQLEYSIRFGSGGVLNEGLLQTRLGAGKASSSVFTRTAKGVALGGGTGHGVGIPHPQIPPNQTAISALGASPPSEAIARMQRALASIDVHIGFDVTPHWIARSINRPTPMRDPALLEPAIKLDRLGANLASAWHALRNDFGEDHWQETMDLVRLGLGWEIESVITQVAPGGGVTAIALKIKGFDTPIPSRGLSDGMLGYLAVVALVRLNANRSLLAIDEPELHLHPGLVVRVVDMLASVAEHVPVVIATHSDCVLDSLEDPGKSAVVCELDSSRKTRLFRPDPGALDTWLKHFRGLGDIRSAGHDTLVMTREEK